MPRLLFTKTDSSVWMSHLDLMRVFQRSFKRAGLLLKHTQGFNPRPSVSIALPLSVGVESTCELLDFELDGEAVPNEQIKNRLNQCLVNGVQVLDVYDAGMKIRDLAYLKCSITLSYDDGVPLGCTEAVSNLFKRSSIMVVKKTKSGDKELDIIPMIRNLSVEQAGEKVILITAVICCQNPTLNPAQITQAIREYLPEFVPDFAKCCRLEIYTKDEKIFR